MPYLSHSGRQQPRGERTAQRRPARALALSVFALAAGLSGCIATAGVEGDWEYAYPTVGVHVVPSDIYGYPRVYYQGRYAYLVGDSWYWDSPNGWVLFQSEPPYLAERRVIIWRSGGRAYRPAQPRYYERRPLPPPPPHREPVELDRRYYPR